MAPDKYELHSFPLAPLFEHEKVLNVKIDHNYYDNGRNGYAFINSLSRIAKITGRKEVSKVFPALGLRPYCKESSESFVKKRSSITHVFWNIFDAIINDLEQHKKGLIPLFSTAIQDVRMAKKLISDKSLVFSCLPFDIATMSMRGIGSCMSWNNHHSQSLAGSIVDPYCAIVFLTYSNEHFSSFGPRMFARCVVRMVVNDSGKESLFLEKPYLCPTILSTQRETLQALVREMFSSFLHRETGLNVLYTANREISIPYFPDKKFLFTDELSYRDSYIAYRESEELL